MPGMKSMNTRWIVFAIVAALLVPELSTSQARAQEVELEGPLAGKPAVIYLRQYRKFRIQVQPGFARTLTDEFATAHLATFQAQFHLTDWLGFGLWGGYNVYNMRTSLTREVISKGVTTDRNRLSLADRANFGSQIGRIQWVGAAQATFAPLRGKLALFQKIFVDTDLYISGGVAVVGVQERADTSAGVCDSDTQACRDSQTNRQSRLAIAPTFAAGLTMYFASFIGLSIEWRAMPFAWNTSGTDEGGPSSPFPDGLINSDDRIFHLNHMVHAGIVVYLPTKVKVTGKDTEEPAAAAAKPSEKPAEGAAAPAAAEPGTEGAAEPGSGGNPDDGLIMDGGEDAAPGLNMEGEGGGDGGMTFGTDETK